MRSSGSEAIKRLCGDDGEGGRPFDVAIVDEATQLVEPLTVGVLQLADRFILVGDARQLPPVVESDETRSAYATARRSEEAAAMELRGLDQTLFERLCGRLPEVALDRQYRMNRRVQDLSNRLYYGGRLQADESCAERRLELDSGGLAALSDDLRRRLDPERALVWETLPPAEEGRRNEREVSAVVETISALIDCSPAAQGMAERIGVISPFRAQCARIRRGLAEALGEDVARRVEVDTVERFQGREKEVMLVSLVVNSWSDFVMDDRRLNVAFTRARSKLIVFGPAQIYFRYETAAAEVSP
jgi:DNA replication ATP-dependent helicase Dna2